MTTITVDDLLRENDELRRRMEEAEAALHALRFGEADALFIEAQNEQVYTLETPDTPYRLVVEQMLDAAATLTADGSIIYANNRFADLLQLSVTSLRGKSIQEFATAESRALLQNMLRDGLAGSAEGEIILQRQNGEPVAIVLGVAALREGALGLCLLVTDLTEQRHYAELRRTQEALRESEARLAAELADTKLLQNISAQLIQEDNVAAIYEQIVEAARAVMRSDMSSMQMLHPERKELELLAWKGFHPESAAFWRTVRLDSHSTCGEALRRGQRVTEPDVETCDFISEQGDIQAYRKSGIRGVQSTPLISRDGRLLGMISTHWRKPYAPAERDLRLLDVVARQAADLIERKNAEQALRDADRKKDEFLATLAHELRNPLAPIRNAVHVLKVKGQGHPEVQYARGVIDRQVQYMARLLEDLLDVSRIARNRLELRTELIDLASVVEAAVETSRPVIDKGKHELSVSFPHESIQLQADPVRLAQVFANLLNNAAKYTEEGGRIWLSAARQGSEVVVSVKDSGIGIAAETLPHIFKIFSQATPALERSQDGLGIGLSLVKGLVDLHGGSVEAHSEGLGHGSEFVVRLPVAEARTMR